MRRFFGLLRCAVALAAVAVSNTSLSAQDTTRARPDTARPAADTQPTPPPPAAAPALPFEFSGIIYANYQYGGLKGNRSVNRFEIERAYLTFRATPGEHFSVRITTDQRASLKRLSRKKNTSVGELLRLALEALPDRPKRKK